jgi:hypothetical protein
VDHPVKKFFDEYMDQAGPMVPAGGTVWAPPLNVSLRFIYLFLYHNWYVNYISTSLNMVLLTFVIFRKL